MKRFSSFDLRVLLAMALGSAIAACADGTLGSPLAPINPGTTSTAEPTGTAPASPASPAANPTDLPAMRARILTVRTSLQVDDVSDAVASLRDLVQTYEGYLEEGVSESESLEGKAQFHIRVPATELDAFRGAVAELGSVAMERESVTDVTSQQADLLARMRNAHAEEERFLVLLADRTGGLEDVLAVERELSRVREQIERMTAQERVLSRNVAHAHMHLDITPHPVGETVPPEPTVAGAATRGLETAQTVLMGITIGAVTATPTILVLLVLMLALRTLWRLAQPFLRRAFHV